MIGDPYDALVQLAQPSDVDTVVVDGRILRRKGEFTALDHEKVIREAADAVAGASSPRQMAGVRAPPKENAPAEVCRGSLPNWSQGERMALSGRSETFPFRDVR